MKRVLSGLIFGVLFFVIGIGFVVADNANQTNDSNQTDICSPACDDDEICLNSTCVDNDSDDDNETEEDNETDDDDNETDDDSGNKTRERNRTKLKETVMNYLNSSECPEDCVCKGSTIKCETENGREMSVIAGKSGNVIIITKSVNASTKVILIKNATGIYGNFTGKVKRIKYDPEQVRERILKRLKLKNCSDCNITLNEDGNYEMNVERQYRVLLIFPKKVVEVVKIDSETGEETMIKRPWWRFIAYKSKE